MDSYSKTSGLLPDFEVSYSFISQKDGGREYPPHQHTRWDFLYEGDDPSIEGLNMIWPEFIDNVTSEVLPEGQVPMEGRALMFILMSERRPFHGKRIKIGTKGYFMEGSHKVAKCTVTKVMGLYDNPSS